jgi:hypothetical protein
MTLLIRSPACLQSSLISSPRLHRSTLLLTILCRFVAAVNLVGPRVVWYLSPWAWLGGVRAALVATDSAAPHLCRSLLVGHSVKRGWKGRGVAGLVERDRLGRAVLGVAQRTTCWAVGLGVIRWCMVASTPLSQPRGRLSSPRQLDVLIVVGDSRADSLWQTDDEGATGRPGLIGPWSSCEVLEEWRVSVERVVAR